VVSRPLPESELVERARGGDGAAWGALVREHEEIAFRTAYVITRSAADAEEAASDALVKAFYALPRFRRDAPLRPWLLLAESIGKTLPNRWGCGSLTACGAG